MNEKIEQLYDLMFSPIITPNSLLDNAKLENYRYVKYFKKESNLVVSMECELEENDVVEFLYYFDNKDNLKRAIMRSDNGDEVLFDRQSDKSMLKERILSSFYNRDETVV